MSPVPSIAQEIEKLRRELHQGAGSRYDPQRIQSLLQISNKIDRLSLQLVRQGQGPAETDRPDRNS